jgi:cell fate regulator YaaT (PSP1 superfamily)
METVVVRFPPGGRCLACHPCELELAVGDACVAETDRGVEFGIVAQLGFRYGPRSEPHRELPRVLRRATQDDEEAYAHKDVLEREGRAFCAARIEERRLPMKLGRVERQLDGKKMTFYFTAEGRVDFRELVRDLTAQFHTRVELRQIGARDDAGMQGGCGLCGRALCCADWIRGFDPVSIKMAKTQGLSLNPAKISGMCGRLMCCLRFEYDPRQDHRRKGGEAGSPTAPRDDAPDSNGNGSLPVVS